jgi:Superfamily II DNA/RNA helicases, SNF2 family
MAFMPFSDLSLVKISQRPSLKDLAPLDQQDVLMAGLQVLHRGKLKGNKFSKDENGVAHLEFYFADEDVAREVIVKIDEVEPKGLIDVSCLSCTNLDRDEKCKHQYSALILLWWAQASDPAFLRRLEPRISMVCQEFQEIILQGKEAGASQTNPDLPADLKFESISIVLDEVPFRGSAALQEILPNDLGKAYVTQDVKLEEDPRNSFLWDMPQVFRKPLNIDQAVYWADLKKQNYLSAIIRYNFTNGVQVSSREILRHPFKSLVPRDLLPNAIRKLSTDPGWPFLSRVDEGFVSRDLSDIEEVIQELVDRINQKMKKGGVPVYLQSEQDAEKALQIKNIFLDVAEHFYWDVKFQESDHDITAFVTLTSQSEGRHFEFFPSFALDMQTQSLVAFSFARERKMLKDFFTRTQEGQLAEGFDTFSIRGHEEATALLKYLRTRPVPVRIAGGTHRLPAKASHLDMHFSAEGGFTFERVCEREGHLPLRQKGWSVPAVLLLRTLTQGLPYLLNTDAKNLVSRAGKKREWDLKLIKHLGILQYVTLEALTLHFDGILTDGTTCSNEHLMEALSSRIQAILVSGEGNALEKNIPLMDLCSKSVTGCFEKFVEKLFKMITEPYSIYSSEGEIVFSGMVEREFRIIFEVLKTMALTSQGNSFKKARSGLLSKMWDGNVDKDPLLKGGVFNFPSEGKEPFSVIQALVVLQPMKSEGVRFYLNGQALIELTPDEFKVDFQIVSNLDDKMLNWFELNPRFFLQGMEVHGDAIKNMGGEGVLEYNGRFYLVPKEQIPSLRRLENFWNRLQQGKKETSKKKWSDKFYQVPKSQTLELLALRASGHTIRGDHKWQELCSFYDGLNGPKKLAPVPKTVQAELKAYQHEGLQWLSDLYTLRLGALLADDMGLGKTLQALAFLEQLRVQKELGQVLVVVPSSLVYNWESEIAKFVPELPLQIFAAKESEKIGKKLESKEDIVLVITYGLLLENDEMLSQYNWNVLIFDEAQNLKNITTKRTSAARMLPARFKICMTGTPMENHYGEFYSLMDLIVPGCLGKYDEFRRHFVNTEVVLIEDVDDLKLRTKPLLLRRTKKEILDQLPEKQETKVSIAFEERQKKIYRDIALAYNEKIKETMTESGESQVQLQMLTALLRLRQACSDPGALPQVKYEQTPPKLEALMESLEEIIESGESALVFTQFVQTLERTEKLLKAANIPVFVLHGAIPTKQRQKLLRDFNETPGGAVLVMTLKTGGVGLNLTKASYVFHLEPWWNPSVENQATDRAHRLGQKKAVQVFRYIMHESLEEKMELLKARKNKKFESLFSDTESAKDIGAGSGALSKDDFDFLLGIK